MYNRKFLSVWLNCHYEFELLQWGKTVNCNLFFDKVLHTKKALFYLLHGSAILLSVPFEDIFLSDFARDLQSFEATSCVCV